MTPKQTRAHVRTQAKAGKASEREVQSIREYERNRIIDKRRNSGPHWQDQDDVNFIEDDVFQA
jgi:hypothetical protein